MPYLSLVVGPPSAGKTAITKYMQEYLRFVRFDVDDITKMLYGKSHLQEVAGDPEFDAKRLVMWDTLIGGKLSAISRGLNVVVDTTARSASRRKILLDTAYNGLVIPAKKYLIKLSVDADELKKRELERRGNTTSLGLFYAEWEEPEPDADYELVTYTNNNPADLERIKADLEKTFI